MKILYVYGDDDYASLTWEDDISKKDKKKFIKELEKSGEDSLEFQDGCYLEIHEFKEIDPNFIAFIKNRIQDYDESKHSNFYIEPFVK